MRELDDRVARDAEIERLARWWTSASEKARYAALESAIHTNSPDLEKLRLAIIVAETEAGQVAEG